MSKRRRRNPGDREETPVSESPFRPTGGVAPDPMDVDATTPGLPANVLESMANSVDGTSPGPSPFPGEAMPSPADIPTDPRAQPHPESQKGTEVRKPPTSRSASKKPEANVTEPEPKPERSTQPIERKRKSPSTSSSAPASRPEPKANVTQPDAISPKLTELSAKIDQQLQATLDAVGALRQGVEETDAHRQELLNEAKTVNKNYKQLVEKIIAERDALSKELSHVRSQYAADAKQQAQAFTDLQRDLEKERRENERKLREAEDEVQRQNARITELEKQLAEAIASRDRIVERVRQVEINLEQSVLPLREELDQTRAREAQARIELEGANKEIAALKLLTGPPAR
jgi:uncharacterized phage infection (PIP) family protein YhgE